ncbi:hypothetical protein ARMGADRAFT_1077763 [Armillaria gallica]|uniref:F-box domain-containing protein n=1 Tax=Armillaria gallica TaxID=47427 RepID=A0A2H3DM01_ARMGA|nr:hypothetical protein ARMGADRAFT_1077763 [Armillaria gallica]
MTSIKQSTPAFLRDLLSGYNWVSTSSHSPELIVPLSTNAVPTAFQAAQLEACIEVLEAPINEIQSEIDLLRSAAASLEGKMAHLENIRLDYRAALSPIRHLPSEILVEILRWTLKKQTEPTAADPCHVFEFNVFKIAAGPWHLGQVCSSWRDAVQFLCPDIWSMLEITWQHKRSEKGDMLIPAPKKDMMALLNRALERSQNHRLDFFFNCWGFHEEATNNRTDELEEMSQCFDLLLTQSKRWGSVELTIVPSSLHRLSLVRGRIDRVEDVYLTCAPNAMPGAMHTFEIAPKLKTLDLTGMHAEAHIPFPAENLVIFSDARRLPEHDTVPKYLDIIASAPNLLEFMYHHHSVVPQSPGPYHPQIVHQSLQTLSASLGGLLCSLVLPALTQMTLASIKAEEDVMVCPVDALFHLYDLVVRSHCSLTTLTFIDAIMDEDLLPILQLSPQLVSLSFQDKQSSRASDTTMVSLFIDMTETVRVGDALHHTLLPCLKELEILLDNVEFDRVKYLDVDFVEMIVSQRILLCSRMLEYLRIDVIGRAFEVPISKNGGLEELKRLGDNGLDLQLDLADWDERVLQVSALPHTPDDD